MVEKHTFSVQKRNLSGKKVKQLRNQGLLVASVSIPGGESLDLQASYKDFSKLIDRIGESGLLYLVVEGESKEIPVLIDDLQLSPISGEIMHATFRKVNLKEKVESEIEIEFVGEVDNKQSVLVTIRDSVEVRALPADLPEKIVVDISALKEIGDAINLSDLDIDTSKITLVLGEDQDPTTTPVVLLQEQAVEEVSDEAETTVEPEITTESKKDSEGESAAE